MGSLRVSLTYTKDEEKMVHKAMDNYSFGKRKLLAITVE